MGSCIPEVHLSPGCRSMPLFGFGTGSGSEPPAVKPAVLEAIRLGYRHFDTAALYRSEVPLGEALAEAQQLGLVASHGDVFVTSKLWTCDAHRDLVVPALRRTLENLQMEYVDLYLIHWPTRTTPGKITFPLEEKDILPLDVSSVWESMEECQRLGLAKSIGVSNFSHELLEKLLATAKIPPAVNQVEMHPVWQQRETREYCREKGIHVSAYSPLGGQDSVHSRNRVMHCSVLREIALSRGKTVAQAQVSLRWLYEQGVSIIVKSFNKERMKENLRIFDWELSEEENHKIGQIEQCTKYSSDIWIKKDVPVLEPNSEATVYSSH